MALLIDVFVVDAVFIAIGAGVLVYAVGFFLALWGDRPAVIRHPITKQWTAARSLRMDPPRTQRFTVAPKSPLEGS